MSLTPLVRVGIALEVLGQSNLQFATGVRGELLAGGEGNDIIVGNQRQDLLAGGAGHDLITGGGDDDLILGDTDISMASSGWSVNRSVDNNNIHHWQINNITYSGDLIQGDADELYGGSGNDWLPPTNVANDMWFNAAQLRVA